MFISRFLIFLLFLFLPVTFAFADITGTASVIDGDTLVIHGKRIRLSGIDAPESGQLCFSPDGSPWHCGQKSALALSDYINRRAIQCVGTKWDRYNRLLAVCYINNVDLNSWLVQEGWAVAYRRYSTAYIKLEEDAKANKKGIWSGTFVMPWVWRNGKQGKSSHIKNTKSPVASTLSTSPSTFTSPKTCCKYCEKGKPCGNTCISQLKHCNKSQGCAC